MFFRSSAKKFLSYLLWIFTHQKPPYGVKKVHLGCGSIDCPGFINIDLIPFKHIHYLHTIERLNMFKVNELDLIYTSHCLEHISHTRIENVLKEYFSKLKTGGILRISVPDFDTILCAYNENPKDLERLLVVLYGGQDYAFNYHYTTYNKYYLFDILKRTGFTTIREWKHENVWHKNINDWSNRYISLNGKSYFISLNIEAVK